MAILLLVHLGCVLALLVTLPYGKFVHGLYRALALVRYHGETDPSGAPDERAKMRGKVPATPMSDDVRDSIETPGALSGRTDPESTVRLLDRARLGDQAALEQLFGRYLGPLQRTAARVCARPGRHRRPCPGHPHPDV
jgi:hypothetical protein